MSEKKFDVYLEFNYLNLNLAVFNKANNKLEYYKELPYKNYFSNYKELDFKKLDEILEKNIRELEKLTKEFIKDVYLLVETPQSISINLSVNKNNEGNKVTKEDATYLIQDARQQIIKFNSDLKILHIIVEKYILDDSKYDLLQLDKTCNKFSIDIKFICFPKNFVKNFENLFSKQQIYINQFVCLNYINSFSFEDKNKNICQKGKEIVEGLNKQEVVSIPRVPKKRGFFEKLFHFFK